MWRVIDTLWNMELVCRINSAVSIRSLPYKIDLLDYNLTEAVPRDYRAEGGFCHVLAESSVI